MKLTHKFAEMTPDKRPQDPHMDGPGLHFETMAHGGEYPDTMPQAIKLIDAEGPLVHLRADHAEREGRRQPGYVFGPERRISSWAINGSPNRRSIQGLEGPRYSL
jgi:hypothetical protein